MKILLISKLAPITFSRFLSRRINHSFSRRNHLFINPLQCLQDEPVSIEIKNLSPEADVTLASSIKDIKGNVFITNTHYRSDKNGSIHLAKHASLGGTYEGVFPMGPIAHLQAGPGTYKYQRYINRDVTTPMVVKFNLLKGHLGDEKVMEVDPNLVLDSVEHKRVYLPPKCQRIPVRNGRIRGTLFLPEGDGPFPGIIDMFGTAGGLIEYRAAQFASRGFASLALAYFDFEDLPKGLDELDFSYFEEAVRFLIRHEKVKKSGIGTLGASKGGDLVCSMGTFIPEVKAVVSINGVPVNTWCPLRMKDRIIPGLVFNIGRGKILSPELILTTDMLDDSEGFPETYIPLHEADAKFLFIIGEDDKNWKTELETNRAVARMKAHGNNNYEVLKYAGAGHLIEAPYAPFAYATHHKMANAALVWGGKAYAHSSAQVDSWDRILKFFKGVLG